MLRLLRRRLREHQPDLMNAVLPSARLQRAQGMLGEIWARAEEDKGRARVWRLVEGMLRLALDRMGTVRVEPERPRSSAPRDPDQRPATDYLVS